MIDDGYNLSNICQLLRPLTNIRGLTRQSVPLVFYMAPSCVGKEVLQWQV